MTKQKVSTAAKRNRQRKHNLRRSRIRFTSMMGVAHLMQVNLEAMKKMGCKRIDEVAYLMTETTALIVSNLVKKDGGDPIAFREPFMHGMGMAWDAAVAMITAGESKGKAAPAESENDDLFAMEKSNIKKRQNLSITDIADNPDMLLEPWQVKQLLGVSIRTLSRWRERHIIPCYRIGRVYKYKASEIINFLNDNKL